MIRAKTRIGATLMRFMSSGLFFALSLMCPCNLMADGIKPRAWALQIFDKSIDAARKSINDPRTLDYLLEADLTNVIDHPKVFTLLETIVLTSTSPACVQLALKNLAYKYYNLEDIIDKPAKPTIAGAHNKKIRRQNTLRLLTHALNHQDLWVQKQAATILIDQNLKELRGKTLAYPVILRLSAQEDWERRIEQDALGPISAGGSSTDSLKQAWAASLAGALLRYDTAEAREVLRKAWHKNRFESFVTNWLHAETSKPKPYAPTVEGLQKLIADVKKRLEHRENMTP